MADCAHWIPVMLEQEKAEHTEEKRHHTYDRMRTKKAFHEIRTVITYAEQELDCISSSFSRAEMQKQKMSPFDRQKTEAMLQSTGFLGGILGGIWP